MAFGGGPVVENSTPSTVPASTTTVTLAAPNQHRAYWTLFNESTALLYLLLGDGASTTQYSTQVPSNNYYELPFPYVGIITGVWSATGGVARIVEHT